MKHFHFDTYNYLSILKKYLQNKPLSYNWLNYLKFFLVQRPDLVCLIKPLQKMALTHHKLISLEISSYMKYNIITYQVLHPTNLPNFKTQLPKEMNNFSYNSVYSMTTNIHCNYNA